MKFSLISNLSRVVNASGGKTHVFAPLLYFVGIYLLFIPLELIGLKDVEDTNLKYLIVVFLVVIFFLVVTVYLIIYFRTPERLQSEWYRIEDKKLDLIASKGSSIPINPVNLSTPNELSEGGSLG